MGKRMPGIQSKRKGISDNGPRPDTMERKGSDTRTDEGGGDEAPTLGTPRDNVTPHADRKPDMVAKHESRPGKHEKEMQELPGKPPKPPKGATERSQNAKVPNGAMPRGLLPPSRKGIPTDSRCIHIMANSTGMWKRRNSLRTAGPANRSFH